MLIIYLYTTETRACLYASRLAAKASFLGSTQDTHNHTPPTQTHTHTHRRNAEAQRNGGVKTLLGRWRPIEGLGAADPRARAAALRRVVNSVVQGSAADLIKLAMVGCVHVCVCGCVQVRFRRRRCGGLSTAWCRAQRPT